MSAELETGMIVVLRNGSIGLIIRPDETDKTNIHIVCPDGCINLAKKYLPDLTSRFKPQFDIMLILKPELPVAFDRMINFINGDMSLSSKVIYKRVERFKKNLLKTGMWVKIKNSQLDESENLYLVLERDNKLYFVCNDGFYFGHCFDDELRNVRDRVEVTKVYDIELRDGYCPDERNLTLIWSIEG